jgi:hypothetical protein
MKTILTLVIGIVLGFAITMHFAQTASVKDVAEAQKTTHTVEATVSSAASKAEKKGAKVYEVLKSDDDETKVGHTNNK